MRTRLRIHITVDTDPEKVRRLADYIPEALSAAAFDAGINDDEEVIIEVLRDAQRRIPKGDFGRRPTK